MRLARCTECQETFEMDYPEELSEKGSYPSKDIYGNKLFCSSDCEDNWETKQ